MLQKFTVTRQQRKPSAVNYSIALCIYCRQTQFSLSVQLIPSCSEWRGNTLHHHILQNFINHNAFSMNCPPHSAPAIPGTNTFTRKAVSKPDFKAFKLYVRSFWSVTAESVRVRRRARKTSNQLASGARMEK